MSASDEYHFRDAQGYELPVNQGVVPTLKPQNSDTFLAPALCKHARVKGKYLEDQQADRERITCAVGICVHYELNVLQHEKGAYEPRPTPFNPRIHGPSCPYNYTGRFVAEDVHQSCIDDPVTFGRKVAETTPYDEDLYKQRDPRLMSKAIVVRDYGCKIPIDLVATKDIAKAVLNHFPDQYTAFLQDFVSNLFGENMRRYLSGYRDALKRLLASPADLNRI